MEYKTIYKGLIWTHHSIRRLKERDISQEEGYLTFSRFDKKKVSKEATRFYKKFAEKKITLLAKQNSKDEVVIISVWVDPPLPGTKDAKEKEWYERYKRSSFVKKLLLTFVKQIGL